MKKLVLAGMVGLVLGVAGTAGGILATGQTIGGLGLNLSGRGADPALGHVLMGRVAGSFVGTEKLAGREAAPISFYDVPRPFGRGLCRVHRYTFAAKVVRGRQAGSQEYFDDGLVLTTAYGLAPDGEASATGCARYRDFSHLTYSDDGLAVERAIDLLRKAKTGSSPLRTTCRDTRTPKAPRDCNSVAMLRMADERNIVWVKPITEQIGDEAIHHTDELQFRPIGGDACSQPLYLIMRFDSRRPFTAPPTGGDEAIALDIELTTVC